MEEKCIEILRSNHTQICATIDLQTSKVLDKLTEDDVLDIDEIEEIKGKPTKRDQSSHLLDILKRTDERLDPFGSYLRALSDDYRFLSLDLQHQFSKISTKLSSQLTFKTCTRCSVVKNLDPGQVSHSLYQLQVISSDELEIVNNKLFSRCYRVKKLLSFLNKTSDKDRNCQTLLDNLPSKYKYLVPKTTKNSETSLLKCCCHPKKKSLGQTKSCCLKESPKQTLLVPVMPCINMVRKSRPNNKELLHQLGNLWNTLWHLREDGQWDKLEKVTKEAFGKHNDNPDILALLYRSEMGTWAFYKTDVEKASLCFDEAMKILPYTEMQNWHLGRIFATRIAMFSRTGRFKEARDVLEQARQSTNSLAPCLATGTLNVFEGLYLSSLLQHLRHSEESEQIIKRAKMCFHKAIEDYSRENVFEIQSFLSEIYIFLAMLELGLDFRHFEKCITERDISINLKEVEGYLNCFENNCWKVSTKWSKMLFFIAKAEQHKKIDNVQRAIDYLEYAKNRAFEGNFQYPLSFIENNINNLYEKLNAQYVIGELLTKKKKMDFPVLDILQQNKDGQGLGLSYPRTRCYLEDNTPLETILEDNTTLETINRREKSDSNYIHFKSTPE